MMNESKLTIFVNQKFPDDAANALLVESLAGHRVVFARSVTTSNLAASAHDPGIEEADVAFGQPDPASVIAAAKLRWVHLTSAGYDRYDRTEVREALAGRGGMLTNSSSVYEEPCAQHALAMMLAQCRQLPWAADNQRGNKAWPAAAIRRESRLLVGQKVLLLSFGAIARRLVELLAPFDCDVVAVRRRPGAGDEAVKTVSEAELEQYLPHADHVVSVLPGGEATRGFMSAARFGLMKPEGCFYNIGRGTTVDQEALVEALKSRRIAAAWLDVTDPEPLPSYHALWTAPNCHITPHTAGGHHDEFHRLVRHFLANLERFGRGEGLRDRVI